MTTTAAGSGRVHVGPPAAIASKAAPMIASVRVDRESGSCRRQAITAIATIALNPAMSRIGCESSMAQRIRMGEESVAIGRYGDEQRPITAVLLDGTESNP